MEIEVTRSIEAQLSAFLDGELSPEELALLVRRLEKDEVYRATLARYAVIGGVMRAEPLLRESRTLRSGLMDVIATDVAAGESELTPQQPERPPRRLAWAAGSGIAAAVMLAVYSVLPLRDLGPLSDPELASAPELVATLPVDAQVMPQAASAAVDPATTAKVQPSPAPVAVSIPVQRQSPPVSRERMTSYMISHGKYARSFHGAMADSRMFVQQASFEE